MGRAFGPWFGGNGEPLRGSFASRMTVKKGNGKGLLVD
jgi:hypothetical protein